MKQILAIMVAAYLIGDGLLTIRRKRFQIRANNIPGLGKGFYNKGGHFVDVRSRPAVVLGVLLILLGLYLILVWAINWNL